MNKDRVLTRVNEIFRDVLDNEHLIITYQTTANDVEDWDSLNHIQLVVAIEKQFNLRFTSREILGWRNVGEMIDSIIKKI